MIDYLFIDLDGPILETRYRHFWVFNSALAKMRIQNNLDLCSYWELKRNRTSLSNIMNLNLTSNIHYKDLSIELNKLIESREALGKDELKTCAIDFLEVAHKYFKKVCLITMRRNKKETMLQLERLGLISYFDKIIIAANDFKFSKYSALKKISFNTALFIGDTENDFEAAKKLGIKSIGIINGIRNRNLMDDADFFLNDLNSISIFNIINSNSMLKSEK